MKIIKHLLFPLLVISIVLLQLVYAHSGGETGQTNSPGEGTCTGCHNNFAVNSGGGSLSITSNIPGNVYTPGATYTISVTVTKSGQSLFGFDFEALKSGNTGAGTFVITSPSTTQLANAFNGRANVTHNPAQSGTGTYTFTFNWTAPASGTGNVTFYAAGNAANSSGNTLGDYIYTSSIVVNELPSITTGVISGSPFCEGETGINIPFTVSSTLTAGNVFTAQLSDAAGSFASPTTIGTLSSTTSGTIVSSVGLPALAGTGYRMRVISSTPAITGSTNATNLTIALNPTNANAGSDQNICATSASISANVPSIGTGAWSVISGSGSVVSSASASTTVNGLSIGSNTLRWTISNNGCTSSTDDVVIVVAGNPSIANAGPDQTGAAHCGITTTILAAQTPTSGTGLWTIISGTGATIINASNPSSSFNGVADVPYTLRWTVSNSPCASNFDEVNILFQSSPSAANAGTDQVLCASSANVLATLPAVGTGLWTLVSGSGVITNSTNNNTTLSSLGSGQNKFVWTVSNGTCNSSRDTVMITQMQMPSTSVVGTNQIACLDYTNLSANLPSIGTGTWSLISGSGTISNVNNENSFVSALGSGINTFRWTIANAPCPVSTSDITVDFSGTITEANAGSDQIVCGSSTTLNGNVPIIGLGAWTVISGSGAVTISSNPTSGVTGLTIGQNRLRWTIGNGACNPSFDEVIITRVAPPTTAVAGANQNICTDFTTMNANAPAIGSGNWTVVSGGGTFTIPSSTSSSVTSISVGNNVYRWTISNSPCPVSISDVTIDRSGTITIADAGADQTICNTSAALAGNTPLSGTGIWTIISGVGSLVNASSPTSSVTGLIVGDIVLRWTISNGVCVPTTDDVIIHVVQDPTLSNAGSTQTICASSTSLSGNSPAVGTGLWTLVSGSGTIVNTSNPNSVVNGLAVGTNVFRWSISNAPCSSSSSDVSIIRTAVPTVANAGTTQNICSTTSTLAANVASVGVGTWSVQSGIATITNVNNPTSAVSALAIGSTAVLRWTIANAPCAASFSDVTINNCFSNTLSTGVVNGSPFCVTTSYAVSVPFTSTGLFNGFFNAELSDASGSFTSPVVIGSGTVSPINAVIPSATASGTGYRIRVVSTSPAVTANNNGSNLSINNCIGNSISTDAISGSPFCSNGAINLNVFYSQTGNITGNYKAELSDANGSFTTPTTIGTGTGNPIACTIPAATPAGTDYRIRIVNITFGVTGTPNSTNIEINGSSCISITTGDVDDGPYCSNTTYNMSVPFTFIGNMTGNFQVQLSDLSGSFTSPSIIGFGPASPITASIPSGKPSGTNYRVRVVHLGSGIVGSVNDTNLFINTCPVGIHELLENTSFRIYPNPSEGNFTISILNSADQLERISIYDISGREIFSHSFDEKNSSEEEKLEITNIREGLYFVHVRMANDLKVEKLYIRK